jgi:hypothetical protein
MAKLINSNAASGFTFGLIEAALYGLEDGGLIVQPRILAKTKIMERTVVVVRDSESPELVFQSRDEELSLSEPGESGKRENEFGESPKQAGYRKWWAPVLDMAFDDPEQEPPQLFYPNNVRIALPWPKMWILLCSNAKGRVGICTAGQKGAEQSAIQGLDSQSESILADLPPGAELTRFYTGSGVTYMTERSADEFENEARIKDWLIQAANQYVNAFRPRLEGLLSSISED